MQVSIKQFSRQKGFSLIEALVAFLVLSVGMLGIASLQTLSIKAGHTAALRSIAVVKTEEIVERMRANRTALVSYISGVGGTGTNNGCDSIAVTCTPAELAVHDVYLWKLGLAEALPANVATTGSIAVVSPVVPGQGVSLVTITINWQERNADVEALVDMTYSTTTNICGALLC